MLPPPSSPPLPLPPGIPGVFPSQQQGNMNNKRDWFLLPKGFRINERGSDGDSKQGAGIHTHTTGLHSTPAPHNVPGVGAQCCVLRGGEKERRHRAHPVQGHTVP